MKITAAILFMCLCTSFMQQSKTLQPVAVVELFTSEGCSSCPPADKLLAQTINKAAKENKNILALAFHVDYWNHLGWKDSFSQRAFSDRQRMYADAMHLQSVYTPQMIVNGTNQFVGSDQDKLEAALTKALSEKPLVEFAHLTATYSNGNIKIEYAISGDFKNATLNFALISLHTSTSVKRGENAGRILEHANVVRQFVSLPAQVKGAAQIPASQITNAQIIAFAQRGADLKIVGASVVNIQ